MIGNLLLVLIYLLVPAGVIMLCRKVEFLGKLGPILILYIIGIIIGNVFHPSAMASVQDILSNATVPLAIPLMLFGCTFRRSQTRSQLLALITGILAVTLAVVAGFFIFRKSVPDAARVGGLLTGVYTGGTMNMAALKSIVGASEEEFILLNSYDMVICFLYLTFLMSFGIKLFRRILPTDACESDAGEDSSVKEEIETYSGRNYKGILSSAGLKDAGLSLAVALCIVGLSAGAGLLAGDGLFMTIFFLTLTTLGIASSFIRKVHDTRYSYGMGMYLIYIFSIVVSSMADFSKMDLSAGLGMLGFLTFVIFGSLLLQLIMGRLFKIDSDTVVISSVTYICSPPFVPMMAASMGNRKVLACGLTIGVVGYAIGNYLGFAIFNLLSLF